MTRCDIIVYVVALQRHAHDPTVLHAKRLNAVVRYAQRNPRAIKYAPLTSEPGRWRSGRLASQSAGGSRERNSLRVLAVSDSSFRKEEDDGHAMKGVFILLGGGSSGVRTDHVHILDYAARKQQHVTRSTFAAELFAACDGVDHAMLIALTLHEIERGCNGASEARRLRDEGGLAFELWLAIDAMSVLAALSAEAIRAPAEKSLMGHLLWLRELADHGVLTGIAWVDTRDMLSDGLTKGSVARSLIDKAMSGKWALAHEPKQWQSTIATRSAPAEHKSQQEDEKASGLLESRSNQHSTAFAEAMKEWDEWENSPYIQSLQWEADLWQDWYQRHWGHSDGWYSNGQR